MVHQAARTFGRRDDGRSVSRHWKFCGRRETLRREKFYRLRNRRRISGGSAEANSVAVDLWATSNVGGAFAPRLVAAQRRLPLSLRTAKRLQKSPSLVCFRQRRRTI